MLHLYGIEEIDESQLELLEAEVARLRATVEELDERLSRIEQHLQPAPAPYVSSLTATAAAKLLGINRHELERLTDAGEIPHARVTSGGRYLYHRSSFEEYQRRTSG